jgi:hypothetical protein
MGTNLEECVPRPLAKLIEEHECRDALQMRRTGLRNGVFMTSDLNHGCQKNLKRIQVAIVVLPTNQWPPLRNSVNQILDIL